MATLSHRAMERFSRSVLEIHRTRTAGEFTPHLLIALRLMLDVDICVVDWHGYLGLPLRTAYDPAGAVPREVNEAVHRFLPQNPNYRRRTGEASAISDHLSRTQWHRLELHAEAYGRVGQEDGLAIDLPFSDNCFLTLNVTRGRRGFNGEERLQMGLLGPHVREIYRCLHLQEHLKHQLAGNARHGTARLSEREREVMSWLAEGKSNAEIGLLLDIRLGTVKKHLENLYAKLGVENRHAAALMSLRSRLPTDT